ncbi:transglycosylase SLT domain-containing protein [Teichococcus aerofrigidensis]|nr:lytic transglycosylase domain-containing protein [Roseomonas sp. KE0001]
MRAARHLLAMRLLPLLLAPLLCLAFSAGPARAQRAAADWQLCRQAIAAEEPGSGLPPGLLGAIALVESGGTDPSGRPASWPWTWNAAGEGFTAPSKNSAIAAVAARLAGGTRSIDIGCMQVNLMHHPQAFASLEEGFEPRANVRYAIRFLRSLYAAHGDWGRAIARYHSGEAERGLAYSRRVAMARLGAGWGRGGQVPLPARLGQGLCAPGLRPALALPKRLAPNQPLRQPRLVCRRGG